MGSAGARPRAKIVLATVKGDVHDIGRTRVDIIPTNNGYTVYNLGIKQPISAILDKWKNRRGRRRHVGAARQSVNVMEEPARDAGSRAECARAVGRKGRAHAALLRNHLRAQYSGEVFYGKDAFEGSLDDGRDRRQGDRSARGGSARLVARSRASADLSPRQQKPPKARRRWSWRARARCAVRCRPARAGDPRARVLRHSGRDRHPAGPGVRLHQSRRALSVVSGR